VGRELPEYELLLQQLELCTPLSPLGTPFQAARRRNVRRVLLRKSKQHIYYAIDEAADVVEVITIWGAQRGREPRL